MSQNNGHNFQGWTFDSLLLLFVIKRPENSYISINNEALWLYAFIK